jgi:hypothetical protein
MKHLIEIDDSSETGKNIYTIIKTLSKNDDSIELIENNLKDTVPFAQFAETLLSELNKKLML